MDNQKKNNQDPNRNNRQGFSFIVLVTLFSFLMVFALYQYCNHREKGKGGEDRQRVLYRRHPRRHPLQQAV